MNATKTTEPKRALPFKRVWQSRLVWVNLFAMIYVIAELITGKSAIEPTTQVAILAAVNMILRLMTRRPIIFNAQQAYDSVAEVVDAVGLRWRDVKNSKKFISRFIWRELDKQ